MKFKGYEKKDIFKILYNLMIKKKSIIILINENNNYEQRNENFNKMTSKIPKNTHYTYFTSISKAMKHRLKIIIFLKENIEDRA